MNYDATNLSNQVSPCTSKNKILRIRKQLEINLSSRKYFIHDIWKCSLKLNYNNSVHPFFSYFFP